MTKNTTRCLFFLLAIMLEVTATFSQEQTAKVYFDRIGKAISETQAYYFRQKADDNTYKAYYINGGAIYFEGKIANASMTNEAENLYSGSCVWYYRNGKKKATRSYDENSKEDGISSYYYETGKIWKEIEFKHGKIVDNRYTEFGEDGQSTRIFEENFSSNTNDWDVYESDKSSASVENGQLMITSLTAAGTSRVISVPVESHDYAIEASISLKSLKDPEKAGLIFGFKDWQNYSYFYISNTLLYIGTMYEGVLADQTGGTRASSIKPNGDNTIKIIATSDKLIYSVNGEVQYTTDKFRFYGSNIGFGLTGKSSIVVDNFIVKEISYKFNDTSNKSSNSDMNVKATGSGLVFTQDGYVLTNYHVVESSENIFVEVFTGVGASNSYKATVVQKDQDNDLAILKISDPSFSKMDAIPYSFKESGGVDVGASVFTIGFPYALSGMGKEAKFTDGKISAKTGFNNAINTYQTSIPVQPGNSGGPLFNDKGQLVGVINAKISAADNVSYAIKLNYVRNLIELLPSTIEIPNNQTLANAALEEKIKAFSKCVVLIKLK